MEKKMTAATESQSCSSSWSNIPDDITRLIMNRLYYVDQIRFRAVCKGWRDAKVKVQESADKLPWMVAIDTSSCYLYDPYYKRRYAVQTSITSTGLFLNTRVLAYKHGWILFAKGKRNSCNTKSLFFYNPFTDEIIHLPKLRTAPADGATFTTSPVGLGCEVFVVRRDRDQFDSVKISKCRPGDSRWYKLSFSLGALEAAGGDAEYIKGIVDDYVQYGAVGGIAGGDTEYADGIVYRSFYLRENLRAIGAFNVEREKWSLHPYPSNENDLVISDRFIESNGNLLISQYVSRLPECRLGWRVFRLDDPSQMKWIEVLDFDNRSLFLGYTSFFIPVEEDTGLMNTIHSFFLFNTPRCIPPSSSSSSCTQGEKIKEMFDWDPGNLKKFWIQLPQPRLGEN